ncbi:MAG TPA: hypothetical protein VMS17_28610 [Gemmataceae bacterium]|nr:hypothetical protein [Gemmataceae bacterium]
MRRHLAGAVALLVVAALAGPCWGQRGVPAPAPAPAPFHPIVTPGGQPGGAGAPVNPWFVILAGVVVVGVVVLIWIAVRAAQNRVIGHVRIIQTPPGEAPDDIRRAWVGVELPLRPGEGQPRRMESVGAVSNEGPAVADGYIVDGASAVNALAAQSPEAAAWWRQNAPHVVAPGYRLFFPAEVCERRE